MRALAGGGRLLLPLVEVDVVALLLADAADEYDSGPGVLGTTNDDAGGALAVYNKCACYAIRMTDQWRIQKK